MEDLLAGGADGAEVAENYEANVSARMGSIRPLAHICLFKLGLKLT